MKPASLISTFPLWPEQYRRFYLGMLESVLVNGRILVHPHFVELAQYLIEQADKDLIPGGGGG